MKLMAASPAAAVRTDANLVRESPLLDFAVNGGAPKSGALQDRPHPQNLFWLWHEYDPRYPQIIFVCVRTPSMRAWTFCRATQGTTMHSGTL